MFNVLARVLISSGTFGKVVTGINIIQSLRNMLAESSTVVYSEIPYYFKK